MDIDRESIAIRLTEERARKGYSQADFARQLDVTREGCGSTKWANEE